MLLNSLIVLPPLSTCFQVVSPALRILVSPTLPNFPKNVSKRSRSSILRCPAFPLPPLQPPPLQLLRCVDRPPFWLDNTDHFDKQHRREAFDASKFPDCPAPVINLLPGCIASPSNTCFANAPEFPQKCLEEIKKFYPALPGLPTATVAAPVGAAPPVR